MGQQYRVKDTQTGKTITFTWNGAAPPTEADMEEVFASAQGNDQPGSISGSYAGQVFQNIGPSAKQFGENVVKTVANPTQTAQGIGGLLADLGRVYVGNVDPQSIPHLTALMQDMAKRWGGWDNIVNTFRDDPVGMAADASTVLDAGGGAMRALGVGGKLGEVGNVTQKVAGFVDPVAAAGNVGRAAVTGLGKLGVEAVQPEAQMAKVLKIPPTVRPGARNRIIETAIEGTPHTQQSFLRGPQAALAKLREAKDTINQKVLSEIESATQSGQPVDLLKYVDTLDELKKKFRDKVFSNEIFEQIDDYAQTLLDNHGRYITPEDAQKMKIAQANSAESVYSTKKNPPHPTVQKANDAHFAKFAREEINRLRPSVKQFNAEESRLFGLEPYLDKVVEKSRQSGIGTSTAIGIGLAAGDVSQLSGAGRALLIRNIINSPEFRFRYSRALKAMQRRLGRTSKVVKPAGILGRTMPGERQQETPEE